MSNITKFPGNKERRERRSFKNNRVDCKVSSRWLQFPQGGDLIDGKGYLCVDVMTVGGNDKPKKLCELILAKEELIEMLAKIKIKE